jgi:hypothetical protein
MRHNPPAHRFLLDLTEAERTIITRAVAGQALPGVDDRGFWSASVIDTVVDALCDLMLSEGFHGEWQPTPLGREIEALIDKLDGLLDESAAA